MSLLDIKTAKGMIGAIAYSQGRNKVSGRPVKSITITADDLIDMFEQQNGKCYWSALPLDPAYNKIKHHPFAISSERLDNSLPYSRDNVVLCRRMFNLGRMAYPEHEFAVAMRQLKEEFNSLSDNSGDLNQ